MIVAVNNNNPGPVASILSLTQQEEIWYITLVDYPQIDLLRTRQYYQLLGIITLAFH